MDIGAAGVDIFFVISGFIMVYISNKKESNGLVFIKNRFSRVYPIYLITLIPFIIILLVAPHMVNSNQAPPSIVKSLTLIPFFSGSYVNLVAWTLSFEFYFYIIFAVSLYLTKKVVVASSMIISAAFLIGIAFDIKFIKSALVFEFIIGMYMHELIYKKKIEATLPISALISLVGFALLLSTHKMSMNGDGERLFYYGIPSAIIFLGFLLCANSVKKQTALAFLGDASYSIYLTHILSINAIYFLFKKANGVSEHYWMMITSATLLSMIVGAFTYKFIEKPIIKLTKSLLVKKTSSANT